MNRRQALQQLTAALTGGAVALPVVASGPTADATAPDISPAKEAEIIDRHERRPLDAKDAAHERILLAVLDLKDALDALGHAHDVAHDELDCDCEVCFDVRGIHYILSGPMDVLDGYIVTTKRLHTREHQYYAACDRRTEELTRLRHEAYEKARADWRKERGK